MNLIIDCGNTRVKLAVFERLNLVEVRAYDQLGDLDLVRLLHDFDIENALFCSVRGPKRDGELLPLLQKYLPNLLQMPHDLHFPVNFAYNLNELGADRIAAAVGAYSFFPHQDVFIIDAGTCVTYDFVSASGTFEVGNIAPGYDMRLRAMHEFTGKLPLVAPEMPKHFVAQQTVDAMQAGAFNGLVFEIEGYIRHFLQKNDKIQIILTGGTSKLLQNQIKSCNFVEPNLVLIGLNEILIENTKQ